ncbi:hypothetical protein [Labedaea rhizosphaerae]|uniref:Uncharacterized protein n=1 Tax=Labedaea rhizosphaerae TaxID=598644 RepID=A0A4R6S2I8_LABRH|nr:hypothetical protein [Labedaea rhizosphaerae]TDP93790.1 hypothetical protein EV186_106184 [Labedaea rhizosphaerae]
MTDTEELIVTAMHLQADRRPDGAAVREALARAGSRRHGPRTIGMALAAAAVVAIAITVPFVLRHARSTTPAAASPNQPVLWQRAMAYEPGWLPADVVEAERSAQATAVLRQWSMPVGSQWPGPTVTITVQQTDEPPRRTDDTTVVDVNGKPAYVDSTDTPPGHRTDVTWRPEPHLQVRITVDGGQDHRAIALHVARALRTDGTKPFRAVVDPGWCPYANLGAITRGPSVGGHAPEGMASCTTREQEPLAEVDIFVDHEPELTSGAAVTARGNQGRYAKSADGARQTLSVPLGDGRYLSVVASGGNHPGVRPLTRDEVIKIADTAVVHDAAYVNWIGTR